MTLTMQLLCSTGALSHFPDSTGYQAVLEYGPQLEVDGFELMFYPGWYDHVETIAHDLKQSGLAFPAMHADKSIGTMLGKGDEEQQRQGMHWLEENCRLGQLLGTQILVLHLWGWPEMDDDLARNLISLPTCLTIAERYHLQIAIETIPGRQAGPIENVLRAIEHDPRSQVALDTEFLANFQQLESIFTIERLWREQRIHHVHVKDADGHPFSSNGKRNYLHPGEGNIDFAAFFQHLKQQNFTGTISLEAPAIEKGGGVCVERLSTSLALLRNLIG